MHMGVGGNYIKGLEILEKELSSEATLTCISTFAVRVLAATQVPEILYGRSLVSGELCMFYRGGIFLIFVFNGRVEW